MADDANFSMEYFPDVDFFLTNDSQLDDGEYTPTGAFVPPWSSTIPRIIICIIGVIGNILVIVFITGLKEYKRGASHWYVLQLAIADLVFLLTLPFKIDEEINDVWIFTNGMCKAKETILFLNYYASIIFLTVMSIDRYVAVCRTYPTFMKTFKFTASVTISVWIVSLIMCIPVMMYSDVTGLNPSKCKCGYTFPNPVQTPEEWCVSKNFILEAEFADCLTWAPVGAKINNCKSENIKKDEKEDTDVTLNKEFDLWPEDIDPFSGVNPEENDDVTASACLAVEGIEWEAYVYFNFVIMFIVPFIIISVCYGLIAVQIKRTLMATSSKSVRDRKKITAMCAVLVCIFVICWLPFHAVHIAKIRGINASVKSNLCSVLPVVTSLLAYLNAAINPYLYNFIGSFKKRFRQLVGVDSLSATSTKRPKENTRMSIKSSVM